MELKPGDRVHWTTKSGTRRLFSMVRREGVIESINAKGIAKVCTSKGHYTLIDVAWLTPMGKPGELDRVVQAVRENAMGSAEGPRTWPMPDLIHHGDQPPPQRDEGYFFPESERRHDR